MEANVKLQAIAPEDTEFYVVLQGSRLTHTTAAKRGDDGMNLCFTVPGGSFSQLHTVNNRFHSSLPHLTLEICHDFLYIP